MRVGLCQFLRSKKFPAYFRKGLVFSGQPNNVKQVGLCLPLQSKESPAYFPKVLYLAGNPTMSNKSGCVYS
ncbi:MAG: hypothetical protein OXT03_04615 [Alphaproteobacteria bacterium]|nr:hypothetical protein [Alphaproteobacteria bacterium]